ncbi:MAG: hypothetical protein LBU48_01205 [Coriobacteriales bacterium]|jgi:Tfp pilus assembly PilM family ATPase|nr:hypothetical protein [Coriobacteriales bacterium]
MSAVNSLYCSPTHFKLVVGSADKDTIKVENFLEVALPPNATINGIVTDATTMTDFFDSVAKQWGIAAGKVMNNPLLKQPSQLVVHTNSIQTKILEVPPVSDEQVRIFIKREFDQYAEGETDDLYDYTILNPSLPSGGIEILATSVGRSLLAPYVTALTGAGYNLKGINIGVNCHIKLVRFLPELTGQSFVLVHADGKDQTITLFIGGFYRFSNRYRLMNNPNTPEWLAEIVNNLSSMLQSTRAQRKQAAVAYAYVAGMADAQIAQMMTASQQLGVQIVKLDLREAVRAPRPFEGAAPFEPGSYLFNLGNLVKVHG